MENKAQQALVIYLILTFLPSLLAEFNFIQMLFPLQVALTFIQIWEPYWGLA